MEAVVRENRSVSLALLLPAVVAALSVAPAGAAKPAQQREEPRAEVSRTEQVLDTIVANERQLAATLVQYQPLVETYLQTVKPEPTFGTIPIGDNYFVGRLELPAAVVIEDGASKRQSKKAQKNALSLFHDFHSATFKPEQFARMLVVDHGSFGRENYEFEFLRSEFLGEVRTLVFDVRPKTGAALQRTNGGGRFAGRIWVEDRDYHIVRFNGVYSSVLASNFHFDSWRMNSDSPGQWLPAYVYIEEAEKSARQLKLVHKGQIRIWGYQIEKANAEDEFTQVLIDAPRAHDGVDSAGQVSPIESVRAWESEAEDNLIRRLERSGLVAPSGEVDKVLETVVNNLQITNGLDIRPAVRCRILMTTPLESFTIGHTIILSRGLLDVLPDEASLAMALAHELAHVVSGHELDTSYAFSDRMLVSDRQAMQDFYFQRDPAEELEADNKAVELLQKSPYKDSLGTAGLFLRQLAANTKTLPALIRPHFGNRLANGQEISRMSTLMQSAPALDPASVTQIAALPLGGRVKVDPWTGRIELMKTTRTELLSAREKMPFQITPLMPYLARTSEKAGSTAKDGARTPKRAVEEKSGRDDAETDDERRAAATEHARPAR